MGSVRQLPGHSSCPTPDMGRRALSCLERLLGTSRSGRRSRIPSGRRVCCLLQSQRASDDVGTQAMADLQDGDPKTRVAKPGGQPGSEQPCLLPPEAPFTPAVCASFADTCSSCGLGPAFCPWCGRMSRVLLWSLLVLQRYGDVAPSSELCGSVVDPQPPVSFVSFPSPQKEILTPQQ